MDKPKCRLCGAKHYSSEPHKFDEKSEIQSEVQCKAAPASGSVSPVGLGQDTAGKSEMHGVTGKGCPECGATQETFADAEKWGKERERRRKYMKARRADS